MTDNVTPIHRAKTERFKPTPERLLMRLALALPNGWTASVMPNGVLPGDVWLVFTASEDKAHGMGIEARIFAEDDGGYWFRVLLTTPSTMESRSNVGARRTAFAHEVEFPCWSVETEEFFAAFVATVIANIENAARTEAIVTQLRERLVAAMRKGGSPDVAG